MNNFQKWQAQDSSKNRLLPALLIGALIFPLGIPALLIFILPKLDRILGLGSFYLGIPNIIIGVLLIIIGAALAFYTIYIQYTLASGTPIPVAPTKRLLVVGPFKYCRNPMALGTIILYAGISILVGSFSSLFMVLLFTILLVLYIKLIEEKELQQRFGEEYLLYKKQTPFFIPGLKRS